MTVAEMHFEFQILLETMWSDFKETERPDSYTVLKFLNLAQSRYLKDKYLSNPDMKANIEFVRKKADDLRNIIKRTISALLAGTTGPGNKRTLPLPDDYLFYIRSDSKVTRTALPVVASQWTPNRETSYDEVENVITGVYNTPILPEPVIVFEQGDTMVIYYDTYTSISEVEVTYLRHPKTMVIDSPGADDTITCELAEQTHEEIVRLAVEMFAMEYKFRLQMAADTSKVAISGEGN